MSNELKRAKYNRIFGGVAAGLAKYLKIEVIVIRIFFVVSVFFSGIGILLYLIMWIVIPEEDFISVNSATSFAETNSTEDDNFVQQKSFNYYSNKKVTLGIGLILIGTFLLGIEFAPFLDFEDFFPLLFIGFGVYLLLKVKND